MNGFGKLTQGLRPGLCRSIALTGLLYVFSINILYYFDAVTPSSQAWACCMYFFAYLCKHKPNGLLDMDRGFEIRLKVILLKEC